MQKGTMKGCLIWRYNCWYGKWWIGHVQVMRRLGTNKKKAQAKLADEVDYINNWVNLQKDLLLRKQTLDLLSQQRKPG